MRLPRSITTTSSGDGHDHPHVVLDQQDGDALGRDPPDELAELSRLGVIESRRRLIEEQHLRLAREGPPDLQQSLATHGQLADGHLGRILEPDEAHPGERGASGLQLIAAHARS